MHWKYSLEQGDFAHVDGLPFEDDSSWWHVNKHIRITTDGKAPPHYRAFEGIVDVENVSNLLIFQRADASTEWVGITAHEGDLQTLTRFQGAVGSNTEEFDSDGLELIEYQDAHPDT